MVKKDSFLIICEQLQGAESTVNKGRKMVYCRQVTMLMKKPAKQPKKPVGHFGRAIVPPERFHTTKKGARGYQRALQKKETRNTQEEGTE